MTTLETACELLVNCQQCRNSIGYLISSPPEDRSRLAERRLASLPERHKDHSDPDVDSAEPKARDQVWELVDGCDIGDSIELFATEEVAMAAAEAFWKDDVETRAEQTGDCSYVRLQWDTASCLRIVKGYYYAGNKRKHQPAIVQERTELTGLSIEPRTVCQSLDEFIQTGGI